MRRFFSLCLWALLITTCAFAQVRKTTSRGAFNNQPPPAGFTLGSFENTPGYLNASQVAKRITDSLNAAAIPLGAEFQLVNKVLKLTQPVASTSLVIDAVPTLNSPNGITSGGVYAALQTVAKASHTQTANTISDFGPAILAWMQAQPGFGPNTVFGANGSWVSATGGTALTQLASTTLTAAATTPTDTKIALSWPSTPNSATYVVEQAIDAQFLNGLYTIYSGSNLSFTQSNLAPGTLYFYRIKAKAAGYADSDFAFATLSTTGAAVPTLATPSVSAGSATTSTVAYSWSPVSNAQSYSVTFATNAALTANASSFTTTATSYTGTGLVPSTTYWLGVQALASGYTSSGTGTASLATSATVAAGASTTALGTTSPSFASVTSSGATASWPAVSNASGYVLQRATDSGFTSGLVSTTLGNVTSANLTSLVASTQYYSRIMATGSGSYTDGPYGAVATFTTSAAGGSTTALVAANQLYLNGATTTTIAASWTMSANVSSANSNAYQLEISTSSSFASVLASVNSGTVATGTLTGLTPGTQYYLRMKVLGAGSFTDSPYSSILAVSTSPANGSFAVERTFKVNLSTSSNTTAPGNGWVTLTPALASITSGYQSANFTAADGSSSTVSLSISSGFSGGGVNYYSGVANVPVSVWPAIVMNRGWTHPAAGGTLRINGLTAGKIYQIYTLSTNVGTAQASYASMTANGVVGGIRYIPGNGSDSAPGETSGSALLVANNVGAPNGYIDLTITRPIGATNQPFMGFILQESSVNK